MARRIIRKGVLSEPRDAQNKMKARPLAGAVCSDAGHIGKRPGCDSPTLPKQMRKRPRPEAPLPGSG